MAHKTDKTGNSGAPQLGTLDMSASLGLKSYEKKLAKLQHELMRIQQAYLIRQRSAVLVFEGWDAAGKGGAIRRISSAMDPRGFKVWPIGAPRKYYLERHFLTRFFERLPPHGAISAFDRSWYGRVLVERVEELTPEPRWRAAYGEIVDFERMLTADGIRIVKLFLHIDPDEQLRRFERRLLDPLKRWKLSYEDFRNRGNWDAYAAAIDEMFERTHTPEAPWTAIPANDKKFARIAAMDEIVRTLGKGIDLSPPELEANVLDQARRHFELPAAIITGLSGRTD